MIVIHIAEGLRDSVTVTFKDPAVQKSAHFLVCQNGDVLQYVSTKDTAFGNGIVVNPVSEKVLGALPQNPNEYTVSIEHEGFATTDISETMYSTTVNLVKYLHDRWAIPLDRTHIIRHNEIEASKTCPGRISVEKIIQLARK